MAEIINTVTDLHKTYVAQGWLAWVCVQFGHDTDNVKHQQISVALGQTTASQADRCSRSSGGAAEHGVPWRLKRCHTLLSILGWLISSTTVFPATRVITASIPHRYVLPVPARISAADALPPVKGTQHQQSPPPYLASPENARQKHLCSCVP